MAERKLEIVALLDDSRVKSALSGMQRAITGFATGAAKAFVAAGIGATVAAGVIGTKYESALKRVAANANASAKEFNQLNAAARQMGATTIYSASQSADALYNLTSAGLDVQQSIATLPNALKLAAAETVELADAASFTTNTMGQFGLKAEQSRRVVNVLSATVSASNQIMTDLGYAMRYAGVEGGQAGLQLEEVAAATAVLAEKGIKGEMAGTQLRAAFIALQNTTGPLKDYLKGINLETDGLAGALRKLEENGLTAAKAQTTLSAEMAGVKTLLAQGADALDTYRQKVTDTDTASRKAAEMMNTVSGDLATLRSVAEEAALQLFDTFKPELREAIQTVSSVVRGLSKWIGDNKTEIVAWVKDGWDHIKASFQWIIDHNEQIVAPFKIMGSVLKYTAKAFQLTGEGIGEFAFWMTHGSEATADARDVLYGTKTAAEETTKGFTGLAKAIKDAIAAGGGGVGGVDEAAASEAQKRVTQIMLDGERDRKVAIDLFRAQAARDDGERVVSDAEFLSVLRQEAADEYLSQQHHVIDAGVSAWETGWTAIINGERNFNKIVTQIKTQALTGIVRLVGQKMREQLLAAGASRAADLAEAQVTEAGKTAAATTGAAARIGVTAGENAATASSRGLRLGDMAAGVTAFYGRMGPFGIPLAAATIAAFIGIARQAFADGGPVRRAGGGMISGPGGPRSDSIAAWLSNGEYVVNAAATSRNRPLLEAINNGGGGGGFDAGGMAAQVAQSITTALADAIPRMISQYFGTRTGEQLLDEATRRRALLGGAMA